MLTPNSKTRVLGKAVAYGDEWLRNESVGKMEKEIAALPTGNQAVPLQNQTGTATQLKEDGIRVILSDVFLKESGRHVLNLSVQFSSVPQSCPTLCDPMNHSMPGLPVHHQPWSSPKPTSIELVMPYSHLILCHPLLLLPPIPPSIRVFSNESTLCMRWPKYWSFSFNNSPSTEHPGLICFTMDWLDLLAVKGLSRVFPNTTVLKH